jgi:hypothetical protein
MALQPFGHEPKVLQRSRMSMCSLRVVPTKNVSGAAYAGLVSNNGALS